MATSSLTHGPFSWTLDSNQLPKPPSPSLGSLREPLRPTDTLIITNLHPDLFLKDNLDSFKHAISSISQIIAWIPLKSFTRVVVTLKTEAAALEVRKIFTGLRLLEQPLTIFWGENSKTVGHYSRDSLAVPALEKNWLISPPGSPPVGWTQVREDPPNAQSVHDDLLKALAKLSSSDKQQDQNTGDITEAPSAMNIDDLESKTEFTLLDIHETTGPGIVVHPDPTSMTQKPSDQPSGGLHRTKVSIVNTPMPGL